MNETNEKYLAKMLEGAEQGLEQVDMALEQLKAQKANMEDQRDEMTIAVTEIKELLGLEEEEQEGV